MKSNLLLRLAILATLSLAPAADAEGGTLASITLPLD